MYFCHFTSRLIIKEELKFLKKIGLKIAKKPSLKKKKKRQMLKIYAIPIYLKYKVGAIFIFISINTKRNSFRKNFRLLVDLYVLECAEHDLANFRQCLCVCVCDKFCGKCNSKINAQNFMKIAP